MFLILFFCLGFIGAYKNRLSLLQIFIGTLFLIILLQLIAAIVGFKLRNKADSQLHNRLLNSIPSYNAGNGDVVRQWDNLQQRWSCCGVDNSSDWTNTSSRQTPPLSCCVNYNCNVTLPNTSPYFNTGCYTSAYNLVLQHSKTLGGVSLFFFFVEIAGLILAIVLLRDLKNNYGSV